MAEEKEVLTYKGFPLMRKDSIVYYGSMADSHIVMLQILETEKKGDADIATKVSVELQLTDPSVRSKRAPRTASTPRSMWAACGSSARSLQNNSQNRQSL